MAKPPYRGRQWQDARAEVLERDGHRCQIQLPKCTGIATQADHIVDVQYGGPWYEPSNLRAACAYCNAAKSSFKAPPRHPMPPTPYLDW